MKHKYRWQQNTHLKNDKDFYTVKYDMHFMLQGWRDVFMQLCKQMENALAIQYVQCHTISEFSVVSFQQTDVPS